MVVEGLTSRVLASLVGDMAADLVDPDQFESGLTSHRTDLLHGVGDRDRIACIDRQCLSLQQPARDPAPTSVNVGEFDAQERKLESNRVGDPSPGSP